MKSINEIRQTELNIILDNEHQTYTKGQWGWQYIDEQGENIYSNDEKYPIGHYQATLDFVKRNLEPTQSVIDNWVNAMAEGQYDVENTLYQAQNILEKILKEKLTEKEKVYYEFLQYYVNLHIFIIHDRI